MTSLADINSIKATELTLSLPGSDYACPEVSAAVEAKSNKRVRLDDEPIPDPSKAQVVGWPPVRAFRRNCLQAAKRSESEVEGVYVKVSMDGAPYLRKVDVKMYQGYKELIKALETMFKCFISGDLSSKESCNKGEQFALTYEDKDGDWMLVGDVPFEMFTSSCKRLRIMRKSEVQGIGSSLLL